VRSSTRTGRRPPTRNKPLIHLAIAIWVPLCAVACYWQVTVALAGDKLGWLYSIEWPAFGIFGIVVWWNLIHDDPETVGSRAVRSGHAKLSRLTDRDRGTTSRADEESPELKKYNDYLAALATTRKQKTWRN
jgi:DNA-binding transcriptional regulator of glucitol operon